MQVRLKTLDGRWEEVGVDRLAGLTPQGIQASSNAHGSDTCRFTLRRDPSSLHPDLAAFTPCELLKEGNVVWSGRVWETPTKEGPDQTIGVEGRGWQYHLDDKAFQFPYSRVSLTPRDVRQNINAYLDVFTASGQVTSEGTATSIGWSKDTPIVYGEAVGITYDLGSDYEEIWPEFLVDFKSYATDSNINIYVRTHNSGAPVGAAPRGPGLDYTDLNLTGLAIITNVGSLTTKGGEYKSWLSSSLPRRYLSIFMWYEGAGGTFSADQIIQIRQFQVYGNKTYREMIDKSAVRASDVAVDSIRRAAPLIATGDQTTPRFEDEILGNPTLRLYYRFNNGLEDLGTGTAEAVRDHGPYGTHLNRAGATITPNIVSGGLDNTLGTEADNKALQTSGDQWYMTTSTYGTPLTLPPHPARISVVGVFQTYSLPQSGCLFYIGNSGADGWGYFINNGAGTGAGSKLALLRAGKGWTDTGITLTDDHWYFFRAHWGNNFDDMDFTIYDASGHVDSHSVTILPGDVNAPTNAFYVGGTDSSNEALLMLDEIAMFFGPFENEQEGYELALAEAALAKKEGKIQRTAFWVPEFPMTSAQTPRECIDAINSYHDYIWKIDHDPALIYKPKPASALLEVSKWPGAEFEEASANAGEEIYNEVRVEGQDALGEELFVRRGGLQLTDEVALSNPGFEVNTTGWSTAVPGQASITRVTNPVHSGAGAAVVAVTSAPHTPTAKNSTFTGAFQPGRLYRAVVWMRRTTKGMDEGEFRVENTLGDTFSTFIPPGDAGFWFKVSVDFKYDQIGTITLAIQNISDGTTGNIFYIDDVEIHALDESLPSRYGFIRSKILPINAAITQAAAERIGDVWLDGRTSTPFKGSLRHSSPSGIRFLRTGAGVDPAEMLNFTGERVMFTHRIDPDTGDHGRLGTIDSVAYDDSTGVSTVTIDNSRLSFEALLGRFAAVVGTGR